MQPLDLALSYTARGWPVKGGLRMHFHEKLQCYVQSLHYDFANKTGEVIMGEDSCTDMAGCIEVFEAIDPRVQRIVTVAETKRDTVYKKNKLGEWIAI